MAAFEELVDAHYLPLYRFAFSLAEDADRAAALVQQSFLTWSREGDQCGGGVEAGTGLFTALFREHAGSRLREGISREQAPEDPGPDPGEDVPDAGDRLRDSQEPLDLLAGLDETLRAPLALFYLQQHSYKQIAAILDVPIGTVMSRISRGKEKLSRRMVREPSTTDMKVVNFQSGARKHSNG